MRNSIGSFENISSRVFSLQVIMRLTFYLRRRQRLLPVGFMVDAEKLCANLIIVYFCRVDVKKLHMKSN